MGGPKTMTDPPRRPESCEHRIPIGPDQYGCGLAHRILGEVQASSPAISDNICRECCRNPLEHGSRVNPVVASLVFTGAERRGPHGVSTKEFIARHWARQFAIPSLESMDHGSSAECMPSSPQLEDCGVRVTNGHHPLEGLRLGLVGPNSRFGLGHINRAMAKHLRPKRWLMAGAPGGGTFRNRRFLCPMTFAGIDEDRVVCDWLRGLDAIVFVESPIFPSLCAAARRQGVLVICHPNWEWLHPGLAWLGDVDVMLCPTRSTAAMLTTWRHQFGFRWTVETLPWPIDVGSFPFRRRERCERFVYVHGSGGASARRGGLASDIIRRKGLRPLLEAVREVPQIPLIVYASRDEFDRVPPNVEVRTPPKRNRDLYFDGDVCLQPSLWEGLGLPLLECQAAGMPLITTDLPPMNEHSPYAVIPATEVVAGLSPDLWIPAANICPDDIARVMRAAHGQQIPLASGQARAFVVREHNWRRVRKGLLRKITTWVHDMRSCS